MNTNDEKYTKFGLTRDMLATPEIVRAFDTTRMSETAAAIKGVGKLFLTGEGSSRIFPAKSVMRAAKQNGWNIELYTEAGKQAQEYNLSDWAVFALSNSGRTAEVIGLFNKLAEAGHQHLYSLTAAENSMLESISNQGYVLKCGKEGAVAATKSVIEQALFYRALLEEIASKQSLASRLDDLADKMTAALTLEIDPELTAKIANARNIYWAGRNDGVTEELTLKTNEITRKQSDFLEGTYAAHGVEEVMDANDVVLWVDPYQDSEEKFDEILQKGVGLTVIAIADRETMFPTIQISDAGDLSPFVQMCAGWNVMVEAGITLGIDLDKPERARKVGNEFVG
ncbi:SIS domain-containing protein [Thalassoglobus sp.]|uniref:SIS domain-containing protein n=1 Tax=Thalassoglobus sp. TaxID=2795869 RepID=UPI003AA88E52